MLILGLAGFVELVNHHIAIENKEEYNRCDETEQKVGRIEHLVACNMKAMTTEAFTRIK